MNINPDNQESSISNSINFDFDNFPKKGSNIEPKGIVKEIESTLDAHKKQKTSIGLFSMKTANETIEAAKERPIPLMLFGQLWYEGEICILFADTNLGKSILAVQIADALSFGKSITPFKIEATAQKVLYFDFELSDKQFETRYSTDYQNHYSFHDNFFRLEIDSNSEVPDGMPFEAYVNFSIEQTIKVTGAKVLIIDNITFLNHDNEKAKDALVLMKYLKKLKSKYELSILILAHTPKRDLGKPLSRNDLSGSKMLINFVDSAFAIGESYKDSGVRYIKQIKERNCEKIYHADNVPTFRIDKENSFLGFHFLDYDEESQHLKALEKKDKESLIAQVKDLRLDNVSFRQIARQLRISKSTAENYAKM